MENQVNFKVNSQKVIGELEHSWKYIGYDECNYTYMTEGIDLLKKFGALEDAPYYFRTHFTFCTGNCNGAYKFGSTNLYSEDKDGNPVYNYEYYDKIIDSYIESNSKPFIEFGFMPMDLVDDNFVYKRDSLLEYKNKGWSCPPKNYEKWHGLIYNLMCHLKEKYGEEEIATWYYELWNEPDHPTYWCGTRQEFFKLFDYTEKAFHDVMPQARLAGPAIAGSMEFLDGFLKHCKEGINYCTGETGTRLDYITFHVKGHHVFKFNLNAEKDNPTIEELVTKVKNGLDIMIKYGYGDKELVLSEADPDGWGAGSIYDNQNMVFRNTEYYASYVASTYDKIEKLSETYNIKIRPLAWTFYFPAERCFAGTRAFVTQGIDKAVFNMFKIYGQLGYNKLLFERTAGNVNADISGFAVQGRNGETQVVIYSHNNDRDINEKNEISLEISGYGDSKGINVKHYRIDSEHSNAHAEWVRQVSPLYPQGEQYQAIKSRDSLEEYTPATTLDSVQNIIHLSFEMPTHGVSLITIC